MQQSQERRDHRGAVVPHAREDNLPQRVVEHERFEGCVADGMHEGGDEAQKETPRVTLRPQPALVHVLDRRVAEVKLPDHGECGRLAEAGHGCEEAERGLGQLSGASQRGRDVPTVLGKNTRDLV